MAEKFAEEHGIDPREDVLRRVNATAQRRTPPKVIAVDLGVAVVHPEVASLVTTGAEWRWRNGW